MVESTIEGQPTLKRQNACMNLLEHKEPAVVHEVAAVTQEPVMMEIDRADSTEGQYMADDGVDYSDMPALIDDSYRPVGPRIIFNPMGQEDSLAVRAENGELALHVSRMRALVSGHPIYARPVYGDRIPRG